MIIENQLEASKKSIYLGFSKKYTLYDSGCLVHCVARLLKKPVLEVHEKLKASGCFFADRTGDVCLLDLTKVSIAYPQLRWVEKLTAWNQDKALAAIALSGGVIVEVDSNSIMEGTQQHFVFFHGNGEMEDPIGGVVRPSSYYKNIISLRIFELLPEVVAPPVTVSDEQKQLQKIVDFWHTDDRISGGNLEGAVNAIIGWAKDVRNAEEKIRQISQQLEKSQILTTELSGKLVTEQKSGVECQSQLVTAKKILGKTEGERDEALAEKVKSDNRYKDKNDEFNAMKMIVSDYNSLIALLLLKFRNQSLEDYLKVKLPEVIKIINSK